MKRRDVLKSIPWLAAVLALRPSEAAPEPALSLAQQPQWTPPPTTTITTTVSGYTDNGYTVWFDASKDHIPFSYTSGYATVVSSVVSLEG